MQKRFFLKTAALAVMAAGIAAPAAAQQWKPNKPINLIVPWAAGGSTDQVTRVTAAELEKVLGQKIVVVNQPGASGSIGTKSAWDAPKDGYTWAAGAAQVVEHALAHVRHHGAEEEADDERAHAHERLRPVHHARPERPPVERGVVVTSPTGQSLRDEFTMRVPKGVPQHRRHIYARLY